MKRFISIFMLAASLAYGQQGAKWQDDVARRLMDSDDVDSKANIVDAALSISHVYLEYSNAELVAQLNGKKGLVRYHEKENSITVGADGAQYASFKMHLEKDAKYGLVAILKGQEFNPGGKTEWIPINHKLVRISGGWIDLNKNWKPQVKTSNYIVQKGEEAYEFIIHWVKEGESVFGYQFPQNDPAKVSSIRGFNPKPGSLILLLDNSRRTFTKQTVGGKVTWVSKSPNKWKKSITMTKK